MKPARIQRFALVSSSATAAVSLQVAPTLLDFYHLHDQPFGVTPDPAYLYLSSTHREALTSLLSGIKAGRGFLALIAEPGMGKTTLLYQLLEELGDSARVVFLFQTQCDIPQFFQYVLTELGVDTQGMGLVAMHRQLNEVLFNEMLAAKRFVLIVDESQNLRGPVLEAVRMLSNFETPHAKLLQIVLAGQPELAEKLEQPSLKQLRQHIAIVNHLAPLTPAETACYVEHRLNVAGYSGKGLFTSDALALVAQTSQGIPRNINTICFHAMSAAHSRGRSTITSEIILDVVTRADIRTPAGPPSPAEGRVAGVSFPATQELSYGPLMRFQTQTEARPISRGERRANLTDPRIRPNEPPKFRFGRSLWLFALVVATGLSAAGYVQYRRAPLSLSQQTATVASTRFEGIMKPASEFKSAAPFSGIVQAVFVKVGDQVREGQPLLALDSREAQGELAAAELERQAAELVLSRSKSSQPALGQSLAVAQAQLTEAMGRVAVLQRRSEQVPTRDWRNSPQQAQAAYDQALAHYQRATSMLRDGLISAQDFENFQIALRMAESELRNARQAEAAAQALEQAQETQARLQTEVERLEQEQNLKVATLRYKQAGDRYLAARQHLDDTLVKAMHPGVVVELPVKVGDQVAAGTMLARVAELGRIVVEVSVTARLINTLHPGQPARVALPTSPVRILEGAIIAINPVPAPNMTHIVEVQFENQAGNLLIGQVAEVNFVNVEIR